MKEVAKLLVCGAVALAFAASGFAAWPLAEWPAGDWETAVIVTTDEVHKAEASVVQDGNMFTIKAGGDDIWGNADQFTFVYKKVSGDFTVAVIVHSIEKTNDWAKAGIMVRQDLDPGSVNAAALARGANDLVTFQRREEKDGSSASERLTPSGAEFPVGIKLVRKGGEITGTWTNDYTGPDSWEETPVTKDGVTPTPPINLNLTDPVYVGIAVTSHAAGVITTAEVEVIDEVVSAVTPGDKLATTWAEVK